MSFSSSSFYLTNTQHSVSRQVHPLPLEGLGEAAFWGLFLLNYFPSVFQSTPFCVVKDALLQCKRASFVV